MELEACGSHGPTSLSEDAQVLGFKSLVGSNAVACSLAVCKSAVTLSMCYYYIVLGEMGLSFPPQRDSTSMGLAEMVPWLKSQLRSP